MLTWLKFEGVDNDQPNTEPIPAGWLLVQNIYIVLVQMAFHRLKCGLVQHHQRGHSPFAHEFQSSCLLQHLWWMLSCEENADKTLTISMCVCIYIYIGEMNELECLYTNHWAGRRYLAPFSTADKVNRVQLRNLAVPPPSRWSEEMRTSKPPALIVFLLTSTKSAQIARSSYN